MSDSKIKLCEILVMCLINLHSNLFETRGKIFKVFTESIYKILITITRCHIRKYSNTNIQEKL